jgi:hypothetical protein
MILDTRLDYNRFHDNDSFFSFANKCELNCFSLLSTLRPLKKRVQSENKLLILMREGKAFGNHSLIDGTRVREEKRDTKVSCKKSM